MAFPARRPCNLSRGAIPGPGSTPGGRSWRWVLVGPTLWGVAVAALLAVLTGPLPAGTIPLPNASFESPATPFADPRIDSWQKTPKPAWWDETAYGPWDQLVGAFLNVPASEPQHIDNCDGRQAIWLFANPQVGLFQDFDSTDWSSTVPTHAFDARFVPGNSYQLTVGLLVGTVYPMAEGASLELSFYYRDAASNRITVAATGVTNLPTLFSNSSHLLDFRVNVPPVQPGDPWAGQHLGVAILSTVDPAKAGGYWDLDNLRLTESREPTLVGALVTNGLFGFRLQSEPGEKFEVLSSTNVALSSSHWTSQGIFTNVGGSAPFLQPVTNGPQRFYRARQVP